MLKIVLLGSPGVGKGTTGKELSKQFNIPHLVSSEVIQEAYSQEDEAAKQIKALVDQGNFYPDDLVNSVWEKRLSLSDVQDGFILDGYPRTLEQASALQGLLRLDSVFFFNTSNKIVLERVATRASEENRADDSAEVVLHRLRQYEEKTIPVIDFYRNEGLLVEIDASKSKEEVVAQCVTAFQKLKGEQNNG